MSKLTINNAFFTYFGISLCSVIEDN